LVVWATGTPVGVALKGIQQLGIKLPVMTTDGNLANAFLDRIAAYTPDTLLIPATRDFWWQTLPKNDPAYKLEKEYHDKYQSKYGEQPDFGPGVAYDAVLVMAQAIEKAGSTNAGGIKAALEKVDGFEGVVGTYHMSADDHRGLTVEDVRMVQAKNGKFTYVGK
ncbi:MAG: ABC transporter substrate-binding protein, partial [Sciscionella sp.]